MSTVLDRPTYERRKQAAARRESALSAIGREIPPCPPIVDPARRREATHSFRAFCETYFPAAFYLPWSADHLKVIDRIEAAVQRGGLFALAMPRGSGKTALAETACVWSTITGQRSYVVLIGATAERGKEMLASIKIEIESNDLLLADFPEACYPVRCLERINNRAAGQTYLGRPTRITWTADKIVFPTIPGSRASGAILTATGLEGGNIRGQKHKQADGTILRPSLVLLDDPQTTESAHSQFQSARRESLLAGDVLGMAGPGKKIAGLLCCTVIAPGDMADNVLNREKHPLWQGERTKMVYGFPTDEKLWEKYRELREDSFRNGGHGEEATEFYQQNREAMDAGAVVAWEDNHDGDEISAIQHAMNLKFRDEAAFLAECQNEPKPEDLGTGLLTMDEIAAKTSGMARAEVPSQATRVVAFIDIQKKLLYYVVAAFADDFTGHVIDYGAWPDQGRAFFTADSAKRTLAMKFPRAGLEGSIYGGLEALTGQLLTREWARDDGAMLRIERCLIDAHWGESTEIVYQFCRQTSHAAIVLPSFGQYVGASSKPFSEYHRKLGDRMGHFWRMPAVKGRRAVRYLIYDTNYWKSAALQRFAVSIGDRGCVSLWGDNHTDHRQFAEHLTAEYPVKTAGRGRTVDEWKLRPNRENHWLDCYVGCCVAACIQGSRLSEWSDAASGARKRKPVTWAEMQARRNR